MLCALGLACGAPARAANEPIKTTLDATAGDGYARLVFTLSQYDDATARLAGNVLIISFKAPVDVGVERLPVRLPEYIGAARRDPDGRGVRIALAQHVTLNATSAGEKYFVDLLPDSWSGPPPSLPSEVIADLARRAREAEQLLRKFQATERQAKADLVRVHVAVQPTFTRYVFDVPSETSVAADNIKNKLTLTFDSPLKFDLGDAKAALPPAVAAIDTELRDKSAVVRFSLLDKVDVRTFRDDNGYVVDVVGAEPKAEAPAAIPLMPRQQGAAPATVIPATAPAATAPPAMQPPATVPAASNSAAAVGAPVPPADRHDATAPAPIATAPDASPPAAPPPATVLPAVAATAEPQAAAPPPAAAPAAPAPAQAPSTQAGDTGKIAVELVRDGANLKLAFPFRSPTAAAIFNRADTLWIVFDSTAEIDLGALDGEASRTIRSASLTRTADADIIRLRLDHPLLSTVAVDGPVWTLQIGDSSLDPTHALTIARNLVGAGRSTVTIPFAQPHLVHHIADPQAGDQLIVVTGYAPARGFINAKNFIEFRALASTHGVAVEPLADDVRVDLAPDKVVIGRPAGLALSTSLQTLLRGSGLHPTAFDSQAWGTDQQGAYQKRQSDLVAAAAAAPEGKRLAPRIDLARFYVAREFYPEAKGVLDVALGEDHPSAEATSAMVLRAVAEIMMNRPDDALKDLADPAVGDQHDASLWRALAYARQGKWARARDGFRTSEAAVATLPVELQRVALKEEMRSDIEVGDFAGATSQLNDFKTIGVPHDLEPAMSVLIGRLAEGMGRAEEALGAYQNAADSWDRGAAAQGVLRETLLRYAIGDLKRDDVISQLETLTTVWRGDDTEIEALQMLARLYTADSRYRDSFYVMRSAMAAHPNSDMTRRIQLEAAATFDALFLAGKGDAMPAIDALALFYDFRELTPIGRRGDEMIRRLADRLVSVDLLDQAADLLQYQVDNRLQGAARAQVAARLAVIYLMNRKADRALAVLRASRTSDLSDALRNQRLLIESRALSDMGRHDVALEVIANIDGREAIRLRSDIFWAGQHWREAAEQIELLYGERWKDWQPLNDLERADILRAAIGYALAEDSLGLGRLREKYAAKMAQTADAHAFTVVAAPLGTSSSEFAAIAHAAAAGDTLDGFLREMRARYPDSNPLPPAVSQSGPGAAPPPSAPAAAMPGPESNPALPAAPPPARAGRTAMR